MQLGEGGSHILIQTLLFNRPLPQGGQRQGEENECKLVSGDLSDKAVAKVLRGSQTRKCRSQAVPVAHVPACPALAISNLRCMLDGIEDLCGLPIQPAEGAANAVRLNAETLTSKV
jgi:hypothetical protein